MTKYGGGVGGGETFALILFRVESDMIAREQ